MHASKMDILLELSIKLLLDCMKMVVTYAQVWVVASLTSV